VEVVRHANEQIQPDAVPFDPFGKPIKEAPAVRIVPKQATLRRPTGPAAPPGTYVSPTIRLVT